MDCSVCKVEMRIEDASSCPRMSCRKPDFIRYRCASCNQAQTTNGTCPGHEPTKTEGYQP